MINRETLKLIKDYEGCILKAYPDPDSKNGLPWTIGYGHTKGVKEGDKITQAQADAFLKEDLVVAENVITKYVTVPLNENQYGSQVSFIHNIGETQFAKSSVLQRINQGRFDEVPGRMALYRNNDGRVSNGLVRRRAAEAALWLKPVKGQVIEEKAPTGPAKPATHNPMDWGAVGGIATLVAGVTEDGKRIIGNVTETIGINPIVIIIVLGVAFFGYTLYNKWKDK